MPKEDQALEVDGATCVHRRRGDLDMGRFNHPSTTCEVDMNRRDLIKIASIAAASGAVETALSSPRAAKAAAGNKPFVLVHGAWHGGWCWRRVVPLLAAAARPVHVVTLTGLGERAHLAKAVTGLATHVDDVASLIECEELNDIVLVGHSYAGFLITGLADRMAGRVAHLVFVDAFVPDNGDVWERYHAPELAKKNKDAAAAGDGIGMPPLAAKYFGITDADDLAWVDRRLTPHPVVTYTDKLVLKNPPRNGVPSTFIDCYQPALASISRSKAKVQAEQGWTYRKLATGHDCMVTAPRALADLLLAIG